jgi:23S rRNA (cytosine1962-C5)-methyltransferase
MVNVYISQDAEKRIRNGHLWIYDNEIIKIEGKEQNDDISNIYAKNKSFIGRGFFNPNKTIAVKILTREDEEINEVFFRKKIEYSIEYRKNFIKNTNCYRLINSEGDKIPSLIVDKYDKYLMMQILSEGMEKRKELISKILNDILSPACIILHSSKESIIKGNYNNEEIFIIDNIKFKIDLLAGQKTGFFLDQRDNRLSLTDLIHSQFSNNKIFVLDCFCYTGAFALYVSKLNNAKIIGIDDSKSAVEHSKINAELNGVSDKCQFIKGNAFDELRKMEKEGNKFDVIILDPPAFAKSKKDLTSAYNGYKEINIRAMKMLKAGGLISTSSCSYYMSDELFMDMLLSASTDAHCSFKILQTGTQSKDHPILLGMPETKYLKWVIMKKEGI